MEELESLKQEIELIKSRNKRVEKDKAWETSWVRKIFIAFSTYILISVFLFSIGNDKPFLNAVIPAAAYLVSTASLSLIKSLWIKGQKNTKNI